MVFNTGFTGVQAIFGTTPHLPELTRHAPVAYAGIGEIVEEHTENARNHYEQRTEWKHHPSTSGEGGKSVDFHQRQF